MTKAKNIVASFIASFVVICFPANANAVLSLHCHKTTLVPVVVPPLPNPTVRCNFTWSGSARHVRIVVRSSESVKFRWRGQDTDDGSIFNRAQRNRVEKVIAT